MAGIYSQRQTFEHQDRLGQGVHRGRPRRTPRGAARDLRQDRDPGPHREHHRAGPHPARRPRCPGALPELRTRGGGASKNTTSSTRRTPIPRATASATPTTGSPSTGASRSSSRATSALAAEPRPPGQPTAQGFTVRAPVFRKSRVFRVMIVRFASDGSGRQESVGAAARRAILRASAPFLHDPGAGLGRPRDVQSTMRSPKQALSQNP